MPPSGSGGYTVSLAWSVFETVKRVLGFAYILRLSVATMIEIAYYFFKSSLYHASLTKMQ